MIVLGTLPCKYHLYYNIVVLFLNQSWSDLHFARSTRPASCHQLISLKSFPLFCTNLKQGGNFSHFEKNKKSQILECSKKLKNEVLSNLEGVDFWSPKCEKSPPVLYQSETRGGTFQGNELIADARACLIRLVFTWGTRRTPSSQYIVWFEQNIKKIVTLRVVLTVKRSKIYN